MPYYSAVMIGKYEANGYDRREIVYGQAKLGEDEVPIEEEGITRIWLRIQGPLNVYETSEV